MRQPASLTARSPAGDYQALLDRVASNLRRLRAERGWTQEEAADRCDEMSPFVYRQVEGALTNLTARTLARLARGFGVDVALLVAPAPAPTPRRPGRPPKHTPAPASSPTSQSTVLPNPSPPATLSPPLTPAAPDDVRQQLRAHRETLAAEVVRVDAALLTLGDATTFAAPRLLPTTVVMPKLPHGRPELREFVLALLDANPEGLTAAEMIAAARGGAYKRLKANGLHYVVHNLLQGRHISREGTRGSYVYRRPR